MRTRKPSTGVVTTIAQIAYPSRAKHQQSPLETFWDRATVPDACWPWTGSLDADGYGLVSVSLRKVRAHRFAYILAHGSIPPDSVIRHTCDNRRCVNPKHLLVGTHADNIADKVARDRQARGSGHGYSKLTEDQVQLIRLRIARGETFVVIGPDFGVSPDTISLIAHGKTWRHVA